ncbi:cytochrome P450 [Archangium violaceum]|uniref:Cytochrome P450 n=1 Tax=Archangium violaceum Cb vi76 TaxID=1406225 RepID=A0A084SSQ7_9BACT|nr:cytochrome P450 [Archangium violaceum]KFA91492.1 cytochrome P450 [Archangium violaceum Cb vi76]
MSLQTPSHPPTVSFSPDAPGYVLDPYPALEALRTKAPLYYWPEGRGWLLTRYEDAAAVLKDARRFSPNRAEWEYASVLGSAAMIPELVELNKAGLFALSGSDHARVRKLVSPALTPRAIERLKPELQVIIDDILNDLAGRDTINVVSDIADRIPPRVIGSMLKIPKGRETLFQRFTEAAVKSFLPGLLRPEEVAVMRTDVQEGIALVRETIEDRRRNPLPDDILTTLIQTEEQGDRLSTAELLSLVSALIVGGFETTIHLIGFTVYNVLKRPELLAQVQAQPELLKGVVEEVLRFDNFGKMGIARYALEDVEMGGVTIKKGQMVLVMLNSALRDESVFPNADAFDVRRNTNASIAFGHGMHFCLGASLARLEVQLVVETFIKRFPALRLAKEPSFGPHPVIRKMETLEVQLNQQ